MSSSQRTTESGAPSGRTRVKRGARNATYDRDTIRSILAEGLVCHIGVTLDGYPAVIPASYGLRGNWLYIHGSRGNRVYRALLAGAEACVNVALLDGFVLARAASHHSVNYRSVVIYGRAREVCEPAEKLAALESLIDQMVPGRSQHVRPADPAEMEQVLVIAISVDEASAKLRGGPPNDEEDDYGLPVWAGELPLRLTPQTPVADPHLDDQVELPAALSGAVRPCWEVGEE